MSIVTKESNPELYNALFPDDEIKEINIKWPGQILEYVDTREHLLELYNYITNLEECHKNMFDINLENDKLIWNLQNENEKLKDTLNKIMASDGETTTPILDLIKEKEDYKSRIEKAVEYIKRFEGIIGLYDANYDGEYDTYYHYDADKELLNILNGKE